MLKKVAAGVLAWFGGSAYNNQYESLLHCCGLPERPF
jgi:hypothetical protein